jgi:hypothetical protein
MSVRYLPQMWLLTIGILCLALSLATVLLALRLPTRLPVLAAIASLAVIGGIAGAFSSFHVHWQPSPTLRYLGFPFPAMIWQFENGQ